MGKLSTKNRIKHMLYQSVKSWDSERQINIGIKRTWKQSGLCKSLIAKIAEECLTDITAGYPPPTMYKPPKSKPAQLSNRQIRRLVTDMVGSPHKLFYSTIRQRVIDEISFRHKLPKSLVTSIMQEIMDNYPDWLRDKFISQKRYIQGGRNC